MRLLTRLLPPLFLVAALAWLGYLALAPKVAALLAWGN